MVVLLNWWYSIIIWAFGDDGVWSKEKIIIHYIKQFIQMKNLLFYDGIKTLVLPIVLISEITQDSQVGYPYVVYGSEKTKFYYLFSTAITN